MGIPPRTALLMTRHRAAMACGERNWPSPVTYTREAFTLVECLVVIGIITVIMGLAIPAIMKVRGSAERLQCGEQLRQIGIALHHYHTDNRKFPPGCTYLKGTHPQPFMNWHTRLLPYLEAGTLWNQAESAFAVEKNFLKIPPHSLLITTFHLYVCPSESRRREEFGERQPAFTSYLGVEGVNQTSRDGTLFLDSKVAIGGITDGASNTIIVGERPPSAQGDMGWWYAGWGQGKEGSGDSVLGARELNLYDQTPKCPQGPYQFVRGDLRNQCDAFHFRSLHPGGAHFLFGDNSMRFLTYSADVILPALSTRNGREVVTLEE